MGTCRTGHADNAESRRPYKLEASLGHKAEGAPQDD